MPAYPEIGLYIDGRWRRAARTRPVLNPADESVIGAHPVAARTDLGLTQLQGWLGRPPDGAALAATVARATAMGAKA